MIADALHYFPKLKSLYEKAEHSYYGHDIKGLSIFCLQLGCKFFKYSVEELHEPNHIGLLLDLL